MGEFLEWWNEWTKDKTLDEITHKFLELSPKKQFSARWDVPLEEAEKIREEYPHTEKVDDIPIDTDAVDVVRKLRDIGVETVGSCSATIENHTDILADVRYPFIAFVVEDEQKISIMKDIASEAGWKIEVDERDGEYMVSIRNERDYETSDEEIREMWDKLEEGINKRKEKLEEVF